MKEVKRLFWVFVYWFLGKFFPRQLINVIHLRVWRKRIDWKHPRDINEKIQWLKFYGDTSQWPLLADKYRVRDYVARKGFGDLLVPLLGHWDKAQDINWDALPSKFVMKTNHGCGDALICKDKSRVDVALWTKIFSEGLKNKYGRKWAELHYDKIKPCIIAEELLDSEKQCAPSSSMIDFKIWAFNGQPAYILVCMNRVGEKLELGTYDLDWNLHTEFALASEHHIPSLKPIPRPHSLDTMLQAARVLSEGFPVVRVDFYEVDGKAYFGEMTFTPASGIITYYTPEFLAKLGDLCVLKDV